MIVGIEVQANTFWPIFQKYQPSSVNDEWYPDYYVFD